jgi:hypothetical protein
MLLRIRRPARQAGWLALVVACAVSSACSNSTTVVPEAFIAATVGPGQNGSACNLQSAAPWLKVGTPVGTPPMTEKNGTQLPGGAGTVQVTCTVATSGDGFDIALDATVGGESGGSLVISSPAGRGAVTQSGGTGITGAFGSPSGNYSEDDCTLTFTYENGKVPDQPPLAAGRIWGHISCPHAQQDGMMVKNPADGGSETLQCDGEADFLFQECTQ